MLERIEQWRAWMQAEAEALLELAIGTGLQGGPQWDEMLGRRGVTPLSPQERARHAQVGPRRSSGPPPIEVRRLAGALAAHVQQQLDAFDRMHDPPMEVDLQLDRLRYEVRNLEEQMLQRFLSRVRPKVTTSSIFANARATSRRHLQGSAGPGVSTLSCHSCGAPRQQGATTRICEFCGSLF